MPDKQVENDGHNMQYFGVPTCPYCKKRVNLIRVWSLKKHGEFRCPRCKGISNIYLSPLIYVFAVIAIAAGFLIYFFTKFISDSVSLFTVLEVFAPFAIFFLLSLFFVYLEKPVIKKVRRSPDGRFFDENGNELKMKMGKLAPVGDTQQQYSAKITQNTGVISNQEDMTGAIDSDFIKSFKPKLDDYAFDTPEQKKFYTNSSFADNEELYAQAAKKIGRDEDDSFVSSSTQNQPVSRSRNLAPENSQPRTVTKPAPQENFDSLKTGRVAAERNYPSSSAPNSGFEDLFNSYSSERSQQAVQRTSSKASQTPNRNNFEDINDMPHRTRNTADVKLDDKPKRSSKGNRFREL